MPHPPEIAPMANPDPDVSGDTLGDGFERPWGWSCCSASSGTGVADIEESFSVLPMAAVDIEESIGDLAIEEAILFEGPDAAVGETAKSCGSPRGASDEQLGHAKSVTDAVSRALDCITLADESLLRGSGAFTVLRRGGRIFKSSEGSAATFELSAPVVRLRAFISHNWSTPRREKYMCLAMYFNWWTASTATLLAAGAMAALTASGLLPTVAFGERGEAGYVCSLLCPLLFLLVLFTSNELFAALGFAGPPVFLDKTCIHQTNRDLQQEGVTRLAAFLNESESMLMVYSPTYLTRLWTVYELASMLVLHPQRRLIVLPVFAPRIVCLGVLVIAGLDNLFWFFHTPAFEVIVPPLVLHSADFLLIFLFLALLLVIFRRMAAEHQEILRRVAGFRIQDATCTVEADRKLIEGNIAAFMQCLGLVGGQWEEEDDVETALETFNGLVRERVPRALARSLGHLGMGYKTISAMSCALLVRPFDDIGGCLHGNQDWRSLVGWLVESCVVAFATRPLSVAGMLHIAADRPTQRLGCNAFTARLFLKVTFLTAFDFGTRHGAELILGLAQSNAVWWAPCAGIVVVLAAITVFVYHSPGQRPEGRTWLGRLPASKGSAEPLPR
uniref:TIR domain-containing protein n=1 Tax=Alexandrium monilatum TaxID=311494 RepID=A0A7S4SBS6_9DINO